MNNRILQTVLTLGLVTMLTATYAPAQAHKWTGRTLDDVEWTIHERLASLPYHGVFNTINFEVQGKTVTLTEQVLNESVKKRAGLAVSQLNGVDKVVNRIEVLPESKRDDALRTSVYRAIYQAQPLEKYGTRAAPAIQIIVKNGWVSLEGVVDSNADRSAAHLQALKVTAHVSDNLRVSPQGM